LFLLALLAPTATVVADNNLTAFGLNDKDFRAGLVQPTAAQLSAVRQIGAHATWTRFGTPASLIKFGGGALASRVTGTPDVAARNWIRKNRTLFKLTDSDVSNLELVASNPVGAGRAVLFRQRYGSLPAGNDGLIIVGVKGRKIVYASSSSSGSIAAPEPATLSATQAWLAAAAHVGRIASAGQIAAQRTVGSWTVFGVNGFATPALDTRGTQFVDQRARLVAVPTTTGARPAYEAIVLDIKGAEPLAYTVFVDARNGNILMRYNQVDHFSDALRGAGAEARRTTVDNDPTFGQFEGITDQINNCGIDHPIAVAVGTRTIDIVATATDPSNDITIALANELHVVVATNTETGTSPEALHYEFGAPVGIATTYYARICQFEGAADPFTYEGAFATNDQVSTATDFQYPPKWKYVPANPSLAQDPSPELYDFTNADARVIGCWVTNHNGVAVPECNLGVGNLQNLASRVPWDHQVQANVPSYTTIGNNAVTGEAWTNPLAPGPAQHRPVHLDRRYVDDFNNMWNDSKCNPVNFTMGNDIDAATTALFVNHNRMHDWSYFLGFNEDTWNLQTNNFGNNPGPGQEDDPEFGQVQAGAVTGGPPSFLGRDNANQISLPDGVPGISNMYLWQPYAGAFYPPCADGDYDFGIIAHEYTHAISNRMAGGPDANLSGPQASAMGEAWGDLSGIEYLNEFGLMPTNGEDRYLIGAYVTGNSDRGIRNYNVARNPLNYSDIGYDMVCSGPIVDDTPLFDSCPDGRTEEHSDAEPWMAVNFDIRQALVAKYNGSFPATNATRQKQCAQGLYPATQCPGNRRWIQIMYDAWLLMPAAVSMLEARDAYLAADMMRFGGANQKELWRAFARRGLGVDASATSTSDVDPMADFRSPKEAYKTVKFRVFAADEGNAPITTAKIYVGQYEAGVTPIADTIPGGTIDDTANFVQNDPYEFLVVAPGYGHLRFPRRINSSAGSITIDVYMSTNRASLTKGAVATGTGTGVNNMFDDTEATNWTGGTPVNTQLVTVDLEGGVQNVKRVNVSALLNPENGGRFHALRQFEIWTCNGDAVTCALPTSYTKIFTSAADAFPGVRPRPTAPDLLLRSFDVPDTNATHVQLRVVNNQCTATDTGFRGEQDNDPTNDTDCVTGSDADLDVKAAELQVFSSTPALPPRDPAVVVTGTAPATVASGANLTYTFKYTNAGPNASSNAKLTDVLPAGVDFVSATASGSYNATTRTVSWNLGTVNVGFTGTRQLVVKVTAAAGTVLANTPSYTASATTAVGNTVVTLVQ
jgi:extracellular elastinolytic metalloproteinase